MRENAAEMIELRRGGRVESVHCGHAVIWRGGGIAAAWGNPAAVVYPRSSAKMLQALPLVESGAADAAGLGPDRLALACASHSGAEVHTGRVAAWLAEIGLADADLRCGAHEPGDRAARDGLIRTGTAPCQIHNNCSGKHAGFLTLNRHLGAGPEYVDPDHPVQRAVRAAWEDTADEESPGYGIDGCSAPNYAMSVAGMARAMAAFATAGHRSGTRAAAQVRLTQAMIAHPDLVAGEGRACTDLMRACGGRAALKGGAEGFYVAILPETGTGIALKIADGAGRAAEAAIAALLIGEGVLDPSHPAAQARLGPQRNWRGIVTGEVAAPSLARTSGLSRTANPV